METDQLTWYLEQAALRGLLNEARAELLKAGWRPDDVERVFSSLRPVRSRGSLRLLLLALVVGFVGAWTGLYVIYGAAPQIAYRQYSELGDEIVVSFTGDIGEASAKRRFSITPRPEGELIWMADIRELHFVPYEGFDPEQTYNVDVTVDWRSFAPPFSKGSAFVFAAVRAEPIVSNMLPLTEGDHAARKADGPVRSIDANIETMQLTLLEDGLAVKQLPIAAIGNPYSGPTPQGNFDIKTKEPNHFSSKTHVWMPYSMQFQGDYFIHGWPYWPDGTPYSGKYSGGCIRLEEEVAKEVFQWASIGVSLFVHEDQEASFAFSSSTLMSGDLVREGDSPQVYEIKREGDKKFKRKYFGEADKVMPVVADGLAGFDESHWVLWKEGVYEVDHLGNRHSVSCGKTPFSTEVSADMCREVWELYGGDSDELFDISSQEWEQLIPAPERRMAVR